MNVVWLIFGLATFFVGVIAGRHITKMDDNEKIRALYARLHEEQATSACALVQAKLETDELGAAWQIRADEIVEKAQAAQMEARLANLRAEIYKKGNEAKRR